MKLRFSNLHARADARKNLRPSLCAALLVVASVAGLAHDAGAAPKVKATPTPTPTPTATPAPTPTPEPTPTATPVASAALATPAAVANYSGTQQVQYQTAAGNAFVALRTAKSQPFLDAHKEMDAAGGLSAKGLKTKEDITARRALIARTAAANQEYLDFVKTQEDTYRAELAKTPLVPGDVDSLVKDFALRTNTLTVIKLREDERDVLKLGDDALVALDKKFGTWTASDTGRITFKKPADASAYSKIIAAQKVKVEEIDKLRAQLTPTPSPTPSVAQGTTPAVAPGVVAPVATAPTLPASTAKP